MCMLSKNIVIPQIDYEWKICQKKFHVLKLGGHDWSFNEINCLGNQWKKFKKYEVYSKLSPKKEPLDCFDFFLYKFK